MATALIPIENMMSAVAASTGADTEIRLSRRAEKKSFTDALLWCALAVLLIVSISNVNVLRRYQSVSLRYDTPFSGRAAYQARQYAVKQEGENGYWLTFWHETKAEFAAEYRKVTADCILYSGDASLVWPAEYISGEAPGVTDGAGCAVSSSLAWELWGGTDVVGKSAEVDGATRTVRGVFRSDMPLALLSVRDEDTNRSFTAVELTGGPSSPGRSDAESFIMAAGLGRPDGILTGTAAFPAEVMAALPLLILATYGLALCIGRLKKHPAVLRGAIFIALIGFSVLLPGILESLPDWIIPTRWSDFSFWGNRAGLIGADLREYLSVKPMMRDVEYKLKMLKQIGLAFLSSGLALSICFRSFSNVRLRPIPHRAW